jgi:CubicO group peptidase (beta-lactamase class C family)
MIDLEGEIDALMSAYLGAVPGACVGVLKAGVPIVRRAYGLADVEARVAATMATNYRLASLTKQFTAAAILLLAEQARLSIDDSVRRWLPLPQAADGMVIRHLLTHTSGVADFEDLIPPGTTEQLRDADVLRLLQAENRGYFPPGASYRYSNSGYVLLGLIAARAAGEDFAQVLRNRIFLPLGMRTSVALEAGVAAVAERAFGYGAGLPTWVRADQSLTSATLGDGGIYSSVDDLSKWDAALGDDRLLRPASLRLAFAPATPTDDPAVAYGFGWRITGENRWHSGESIGFRHVIVRNLADRTSVIVLTNRDAPEPYRTALAIAEIARRACGARVPRGS